MHTLFMNATTLSKAGIVCSWSFIIANAMKTIFIADAAVIDK